MNGTVLISLILFLVFLFLPRSAVAAACSLNDPPEGDEWTWYSRLGDYVTLLRSR